MKKNFLQQLLWYISPYGIDYISGNEPCIVFNGHSFIRMRKFKYVRINEIYCSNGIFPAIFGRDTSKYNFSFFTYQTKQGSGFLQFNARQNNFFVKTISPENVSLFLLDSYDIDDIFFIPIMFSSIRYQEDIVSSFVDNVFKISYKKYPLLHAILHRTKTPYSVELSMDDIENEKYTIILGKVMNRFIPLEKEVKMDIPVSHNIIGGISL